MFESMSDFIARIQPGSWPDWIAAIGTTAAFLVAAVAYSRDVRTRRWAQARLVHVELRDLHFFGPREVAPLLAHGAGIGGGDVPRVPLNSGAPPVTRQLLLEPAGLATAAVQNGSDEVFGPAFVRALGRTGPGIPWDFEVTSGPVSPRSERVVELCCSNPHYPSGQPGIELEVVFRDSAGRWWRRRGYEPVRRARDKEREVRRFRRGARCGKARTRWRGLFERFPGKVRGAVRVLQARWQAGRR